MNGTNALHMRKKRNDMSKINADRRQHRTASKRHEGKVDLLSPTEQTQNDNDSTIIRANLEKWFPKKTINKDGTRGFEVNTQVSAVPSRSEPHEAYMIIHDKEHNDTFRIKLPLYSDKEPPTLIGFILNKSDNITPGLLAQTIDTIQQDWLQICVTLNKLRSKEWTLTHEIETFIDENECMIQMQITGSKMFYKRSVLIQSSTEEDDSEFAVKTGGTDPSPWSKDINNITDQVLKYFDSWLGARYEDLLQRTTMLVQV